MITPRRTRLVRVPHLQAFRAAIATLAASNGGNAAIVVPTRGAAHQLRRSVGDRPAIVTRDELYDLLHSRLDNPPRRLSVLERDVLGQAAARAAAASGSELSFQLRPGLVAEMLRFYDHLRRQSQQVGRFEELIDQALGSDDVDRAAARMRLQTRFLAAAFRDYERRVRESDGCDEQGLRERLMAEPARDPVRHVVVTVADWIADAEGLFSADFDLLTRLPGLEELDIVATERILGSGFHERLHNWWPGLEEAGFGTRDSGFAQPVLMTPAVDGRSANPDRATPEHENPERANPESQIRNPEHEWWTYRDREEELVAIARQLKADRRAGEAVPLDRVAVVVKRPLPYLYLAAEVFGAAGIPYRASDALPLAAEPTAAALDLILEAVSSNFTRATLVSLLRSPHFSFTHVGEPVTREAVSALDRRLSKARYLGDVERLDALAAGWVDGVSSPALHAAVALVHDLAPLATTQSASAQIARLLAFWSAHLRAIADDDPFAARERRARAAIDEMLSSLAAVHATHDDVEWTIDNLAIAVRRWIEEQTFVLDEDSSARGLHLVDDQAVRYGNFDDVWVVGVVEPDWPERPRRNIFYPPGLLKALGWPSEKDRRGGADSRFLDLLASASRRTAISTFTLEDDALVTRSMQLDEIPRARLSSVARATTTPSRVFADEALSLPPLALDTLDENARRWADVRIARSPSSGGEFHGAVRELPARAWSVSAIETYLDCPFKFFAQHVLKLEEEPDDEEVMDPRRQGLFVHRVFERFFEAWQEAGHGAITPANLDAARELFTTVVDGELETLPSAEAGLERTRLLGSPAAAGLGDAVFHMEAERPVAVVRRLLEHRLDGEFTFHTNEGPRTVALRGKADRVDLLEDGTFRLIDYKLGWPPKTGHALQLPIYSLSAEQQLSARDGRRWTLSEAAYLAFKGPRRVVPLFSTPAARTKVLAEAQQRLVDTIDRISRGEFPPTPEDVWLCETCSFAAVCRKDYVGDV